MTKLEITLSLVCVGLLSVVILLALYSVNILRKLWRLSANMQDVQYMISSFREHLQMVYEMETFYGDQTLEHLLHHAVSFNEQLETFEYIYSLTEPEAPEITDDSKEPELIDEENEEEESGQKE